MYDGRVGTRLCMSMHEESKREHAIYDNLHMSQDTLFSYFMITNSLTLIHTFMPLLRSNTYYHNGYPLRRHCSFVIFYHLPRYSSH